MNDRTELIERLKTESTDLHRWAHEGNGGEAAERTANLIDEAITALSPVLPEDVNLEYQRMHGAAEHETNETMRDHYLKWADLLEQVQISAHYWENACAAALKQKEPLKQRTEELENEINNR